MLFQNSYTVSLCRFDASKNRHAVVAETVKDSRPKECSNVLLSQWHRTGKESSLEARMASGPQEFSTEKSAAAVVIGNS